MSARDAILAQIRRSLGASGTDPARHAAVRERLVDTPRGVIPARGQLDGYGRRALFERMAGEALAELESVAVADVPGRVAEALAARGLPPVIRTGDDPRIARLDWTAAPGLAVSRGPASPDDAATLSHADAGIAETGTLVLVSGRANPTSLNFLPQLHIVMLDADDIVGDAETALERIGRLSPGGGLPRTINFVTGPSRSGDIEQTMILGAHGPRELLVLLVAGS